MIEVCHGFGDSPEHPGVEWWQFAEKKYLCKNCANIYGYDREWEGVYFKEVTCEKNGNIMEI